MPTLLLSLVLRYSYAWTNRSCVGYGVSAADIADALELFGAVPEQRRAQRRQAAHMLVCVKHSIPNTRTRQERPLKGKFRGVHNNKKKEDAPPRVGL